MAPNRRSPQPLRLADPRLVRILPAQDRGDGGDAVGSDRAARAAAARASSPSPMAPAARRARAPTRRSSASRARRDLKPAAHLTCVGASQGRDRRDRARILRRGRAPHRRAARRFAGRRRRALCRRLRTATSAPRISSPRSSGVGDFEVSVSAYPEKHPQSPTLLHDVEALKRKVDAGADRAITQFFFDNAVYFRFLDVAAAAGIDNPDRAGHRAGAEFQADRRISPSARARACRLGSPNVSRGSRTIRRRAASSPRRFAPSR